MSAQTREYERVVNFLLSTNRLNEAPSFLEFELWENEQRARLEVASKMGRHSDFDVSEFKEGDD